MDGSLWGGGGGADDVSVSVILYNILNNILDSFNCLGFTMSSILLAWMNSSQLLFTNHPINCCNSRKEYYSTHHRCFLYVSVYYPLYLEIRFWRSSFSCPLHVNIENVCNVSVTHTHVRATHTQVCNYIIIDTDHKMHVHTTLYLCNMCI